MPRLQLDRMLHGADYYPEQWPEELWAEDFRLMQMAGTNVMTVGVFAWSHLEPRKGRYDFAWLDRVLDGLQAAGQRVWLATPSGARPPWLAARYPETCRVTADRRRELSRERHNHCPTSPVYRRLVTAINTRLAQRYGQHPAVLGWHVGNEFSGECHCDLCQEAFRGWLRTQYGNDLEQLNQAWWNSFWSHRYSDWKQISSPGPLSENQTPGLKLDWMRFVSAQTTDFLKQEIAALRGHDQRLPVTTNFMGSYPGLDYNLLAKELDVISWDAYPRWHQKDQPDWKTAAECAFHHDLMRSLKRDRPWVLMESTPSQTNWMSVNKLKRPGLHVLSCLQAVAHGADAVQYFQWRKGRGGMEQHHGAVVDHVGHERTRVFREVQEVGQALARLQPVVGSTVQASVALIYDWENRWAIDGLYGWSAQRNYTETCINHYRNFWNRGIAVDVVDQLAELSPYRLVVVPMGYLLRPGFAQKLRSYVEKGGSVLATYGTGQVDQQALAHLGGYPGAGLREVFGIWVEEFDSLYPGERRSVLCEDDNFLGVKGQFEVLDYWENVHLEGARALARFGEEMFAGQPALTVNHFGEGQAFYLAARSEERFLSVIYDALIDHLLLRSAIAAALPRGVTAQRRVGARQEFVFILNANGQDERVDLGSGNWLNLLSGETVTGMVRLAPWGLRVLARDLPPSSVQAKAPA